MVENECYRDSCGNGEAIMWNFVAGLMPGPSGIHAANQDPNYGEFTFEFFISSNGRSTN